MGNLTLQAESLGLKVHQMAGFDAELARRKLNIPEDYEPVAIVAAGYPVEPTPPDEKRNRRALKDIVFNGSWNNATGLPGANA
jgi:nitroreductase